MTLTERIRKMVVENYYTKESIKQHPIHKYFYINVKMKRTVNYIAFRKWWNSKIQGRVLNLKVNPCDNDFIITIGAISKNTNDILTIKINYAHIQFKDR